MYLITGASGLLGLTLAKYLTQQGVPVTGLSLQKRVRMDGLDYFQCDLRDSEAVMTMVRRIKPNVLIHCAAATNVDWCEKNPEAAFAANVQPCENLVSAANEINAAIILISTDSVFEGARGNYVEEDETRPLNVYARTKWAAEQIVSARASQGTILRTNIFGWNGQPKKSLAEWILDELRSVRRITGFEDVIFSPLLTSDLSAVILKVAQLRLRGLYHAAASDAYSKLGFACKLAEIYRLNEDLIQPGKLSNMSLIAPRPLNTSLCSARLKVALGESLPSVEEGLERFLKEEENGWAQALKTHIL